MSRNDFFKKSFPLLAFGLLFTFFSSYGQTFLLSLYVPSIERLLNISNTAFGSLYAAATLSSAFTLPWLGGYFDKMRIQSYALMVVTGLTAALLLLSFAQHVFIVALAFYGLRLFGQALMGHTAISAMARYFSANRGKAIGLATLGHPAGEALFPIAITLLIGATGWRGTLQLSALSCVLIIMPLAIYLLRRSKVRIRAYEIQSGTTSTQSAKAKVLDVVWNRKFGIIAPLVFMLGFLNTAVFFFQLKLGAARGWSPEWVAGSISAFALAGALGMVGSGPLVDRFSGRRLFPIFVLPYLIGLVVLVFGEHRLAYPLALLLLGISNGAGSTVKNAMLAEIYGIAVIGQVRSVFTTAMVVSTGLGPITFGIMLDAGWSFSWIFGAMALVMALTVANAWRRLGI